MTQLRALYLTYLSKSTTTFVPPEEAKELAFQVLDILTIRPDIELCYLAINVKCFEIIESRVKPSDLQLEDETPRFAQPHTGEIGADPEDEGTEAEEEEQDESAAHDEEEEDENEEHESEGEESIVSEEVDSEPEEEKPTRVKMNLREILFYDDKVPIFKARHGRS